MSMETGPSSRPVGLHSLPRRQVLITFGGVLMAMFLGSLDQTVVGTAMPRIISDLGGFSQYTWVTTAYIITSAVTIPITGKLTDMYGRKAFYLGGLGIFVVASLLCGLSNSMMQIIIARGVQGIGAGVMMTNAFTAIGDLFPPAERGKYVGYTSGVMGLSSIIGPTVGGFLTDALSWHWVFFVNVPLALVIIVLFIKFFPNVRPDNLKHKIDYAGLVTLIFAVAPLMLALSWAGVEYPWGSPTIIGMFIFSAAMLTLLLFVEGRSPEPIIPLVIFKNRIVSVSLVVTFIIGIYLFVPIFIPLFFQGVLGTSATASGTYLIPMMLSSTVGSLISGQLLARAGGHYRLQGAAGLIIIGIGMALLSHLSAQTSYGATVLFTMFNGLGIGILMPLYTIAIQNAVPYKYLGAATSATPFFRSVGSSVGLAVLGSVMNNRFGAEFTRQLPEAVKAAVPPDQLASLAYNPQVLVSPEAQAQLQAMLGKAGPQGAVLYAQVLQALRQALGSTLAHIFLIGLFIAIVAFVINLFVKEVPLRKHH